ncbi:NAD(P)/FAD-dependent oxidoreductase [Dactylosporangium aurantiacum]|uniref:NAD(P)/FAD-dependent oxidoreductase n=1 Tax=Dactylosporangium aurantiacum TaxID=35754 RepID=A0A9Q9IAC3_9ACTN|nr:NAD(P)/FAD-dependent oxidoreductase [Dactylosporangium aurantiacum]MDG6101358.1 NAD(P)/FAD-dependent oxidoreductase [Dactylosporangium aurantiacum]UWZ52784.1 NAD(P)/FAD-dependent oxidoreductase [Dactylosporangium aurantiacum]
MYDVIVVGARPAGAATAVLLARRGLKVLLVDRARFPSDTLSTHQVQPAGIDRLRRWGLLDGLLAAGTPVTERVRFDVGGTVLAGGFPQGGTLCSPRRTVLDTLLVDAARQAGAEVVEGFHVAGLTRDGTGRVDGIRGRDGGEHHAPVVVGADGKHSLVAKEVAAPVLRAAPARTVASYAYWEGVELPQGELYHRPGRAVAAFPTNDGLTMVYAAAPVEEFGAWRTDVEGHLLAAVDGCGDLGARVRAGRRAERLRTTIDLPNVVRRAYGPGWFLAGDAATVMDPVTAQGISNALADAELLADTIAEGRGGEAYQRARDEARLPLFELTIGLARLRPPRGLARLFLRAAARRRASTEQFLGVFAGTVPVRTFRRPGNVARILLQPPGG